MTRRVAIAGLVALVGLSALPARAVEIGAVAPDFTLTDLAGNRHRLSSKKGHSKAVVLIWISTRCPVSEDYNGRYKQLYNEFRGTGATFFFINSNVNEPTDEVREHARRNEFGFTILKDPGNRVADAYGAQRTPEVFVLDTDLRLRYHGAIDNNQDTQRVSREQRWARAAISSVLNGRRPNPAETRAFGCTIKRQG